MHTSYLPLLESCMWQLWHRAIFYFYSCAFEQLLTSGKFCQVIVPSELKKKPTKDFWWSRNADSSGWKAVDKAGAYREQTAQELWDRIGRVHRNVECISPQLSGALVTAQEWAWRNSSLTLSSSFLLWRILFCLHSLDMLTFPVLRVCKSVWEHRFLDWKLRSHWWLCDIGSISYPGNIS